MIRFFVSVILPSLAFSTAWIGFLGFWATRRMRQLSAERRALRAQRRVIQQARDVLAMVISDSLTPDARDQALSAYETLGRLIREREIS